MLTGSQRRTLRRRRLRAEREAREQETRQRLLAERETRRQESRQRLRAELAARGQETPEAALTRAAGADRFHLPGYYYDRAREKYFRINAEFLSTLKNADETGFLPPRKPSIESVPTLALLRQHGLLRRPFPAAALESKLEGVAKTNSPRSFQVGCEPLFACEALLTDDGLDFVSSVWLDRTRPGKWLLIPFERCVLPESRTCGAKADSEDASPRMVLQQAGTPTDLGPFKPRDACIAAEDDGSGRFRILTCQVGCNSTGTLLSFDHCRIREPARENKALSPREAVFSCAYSRASERAAFGMETCGLVYRWDSEASMQLTKTYSTGRSVFCMAFDSSGRIVYGGSRSGTVFCSDLRCDSHKSCSYKITLKPHALRALRVLKDDTRLVVGGDEHQLLSVDLRTRRPVLSYEDQSSRDMKISFAVDEELGVLCSAGQDCRTRLWNLNTGRLVSNIKSPILLRGSEIPSAVFKSSWGRTLSVPAVVVGYFGKMYIYQV